MTERPSPTACDRCGTFARLIDQPGGRYCAACLERMRHPIQRGEITFETVIDGVWLLLRAIGLRAAAVVVGFTLAEIAAAAAWHGHLLLVGLGERLLALVSTGVILGLARDAVDAAARPSVFRATLRVLRRLWPLLFADLALSLGFEVGLVFLVVPGLVFYLSFWLVLPIVLDEGLRPMAALGASYDRMMGHRLLGLGAWVLAAVPGAILAYVLVAPRMAWIVRHHGLTPPIDLSPGHLALEVLHALVTMLPPLLVATFYEKTRPEVRAPWRPPGTREDDGITELDPAELDLLPGTAGPHA